MSNSTIEDIKERLRKIQCQIEYNYRSIQVCVGPGCSSLFQDIERLYEEKATLEGKLRELCKNGENF